MFQPAYPSLPWLKLAYVLSCGIFTCLIFEPLWWMYLVVFSTSIITFIWLVWDIRKDQLRAHAKLKVRGLQFVWENHPQLPERFTPDNFIEFYESRLTHVHWRKNLVDLISDAQWLGVTDTLTHPATFRWELRTSLPKNWTADDRFCMYITLMASIPNDYGYSMELNDTNLCIKTNMAHVGQPPKTHVDTPIRGLVFWSSFQRDLGQLTDTTIMFKKPQFEIGLTQDIELDMPATYNLVEGGNLHVDKDQDGIHVVIKNKHGTPGPIQRYKDENAFWWVWRNAIERRSLGSPSQ